MIVSCLWADVMVNFCPVCKSQLMVVRDTGKDTTARKELSAYSWILTERAVDDWFAIISPPGPTAARLSLVARTDLLPDGMSVRTITRIFDTSDKAVDYAPELDDADSAGGGGTGGD